MTWMETSAPTNNWWSVASSADGAKLIAVSDLTRDAFNINNPGLIHTSADSGVTWRQTSAPSNNIWSSVASSADGSQLVAVSLWVTAIDNPGHPGVIYTSADSGMTWRQTSAPSDYWSSVASSADGTRIVAAVGSGALDLSHAGPICTSTNSGKTWKKTSAPGGTWSSVASSADGSKLVAVTSDDGRGNAGSGLIYVSRDSGATWTQTSAPNKIWSSVASSANGMRTS